MNERDKKIEELASQIEHVVFESGCSIKGSDLRTLLRDELPKEDRAQVRYVYGQFADHARNCCWCDSTIDLIKRNDARILDTCAITDAFKACPVGHAILMSIFN